MYGICIRYTSDPDEAKDIMQEGFIKIFSHIRQYKAKGSFEGWMKRIMVNTAITHYHKNKKGNVVGRIEEIDESGILHEQSQTEEMEEGIDKADINSSKIDYRIVSHAQLSVNELLKALHVLPEAFKMVFNLHCIEGYKHKEIAGMLKIDEKTSRTRLLRARNILQKEIYKMSIIKVGK